MTAPLRRAGSGRAPDGALVTWSVAEGGRGRRWRWVVAGPDGAFRHAGLIEFDLVGRFARLELASLAGMLTLHPAGDGRTAHGNVVRPTEVDPLEVAWPDRVGLAISGDAFGSVLAPGAAARERWTVTESLSLRWELPAGPILAMDARGIPVLADAQEWALETD